MGGGGGGCSMFMLPPFHMAYALGGDTLLLDCVQPRASLWWLKINEVTLFGQFGTVQYVVRQGMLLVHLVVVLAWYFLIHNCIV